MRLKCFAAAGRQGKHHGCHTTLKFTEVEAGPGPRNTGVANVFNYDSPPKPARPGLEVNFDSDIYYGHGRPSARKLIGTTEARVQFWF
jgi:hypothetical protein